MRAIWTSVVIFTFKDAHLIYYCNLSHLSGLERVLDTQLHGQHLAKSVILPAVRSHIYNDHPHKALVLSLHGQVGVGKSFVAGMIVDHLYLNGARSRFVHKKVGSHHYGHEGKIWQYKVE